MVPERDQKCVVFRSRTGCKILTLAQRDAPCANGRLDFLATFPKGGASGRPIATHKRPCTRYAVSTAPKKNRAVPIAIAGADHARVNDGGYILLHEESCAIKRRKSHRMIYFLSKDSVVDLVQDYER